MKAVAVRALRAAALDMVAACDVALAPTKSDADTIRKGSRWTIWNRWRAFRTIVYALKYGDVPRPDA